MRRVPERAGNVPTTSKPIFCHSEMARRLVLTTKLNCIARYPWPRAVAMSVRTNYVRTPLPVALGAVTYPQFANMLTTARLIGTHVIGAEDGARLLATKTSLSASHPVRESLCPAQVGIKRIGFSRSIMGSIIEPNGGSVCG